MTRWRADISVWNERGCETCCLLPGNTRKFGMDYSWTMYIFRNWLGIQQICSETNYEIRLATVHKQNIVNSGSNNWVIGTHYRDATYKQPLRAIITIFVSSIIMGWISHDPYIYEPALTWFLCTLSADIIWISLVPVNLIIYGMY